MPHLALRTASWTATVCLCLQGLCTQAFAQDAPPVRCMRTVTIGDYTGRAELSFSQLESLQQQNLRLLTSVRSHADAIAVLREGTPLLEDVHIFERSRYDSAFQERGFSFSANWRVQQDVEWREIDQCSFRNGDIEIARTVRLDDPSPEGYEGCSFEPDAQQRELMRGMTTLEIQIRIGTRNYIVTKSVFQPDEFKAKFAEAASTLGQDTDNDNYAAKQARCWVDNPRLSIPGF